MCLKDVEEKNKILLKVADSIFQNEDTILQANEKDVKNAQERRIKESLIDRLNLFVELYDNNSVDFIFTQDRLKVMNKKKTCDENIEYVSKNVSDLVELPCVVNIADFKSQLDVMPSDEITFRFGGIDTGMAMVDGDITQVVALLGDM